MTVNHLLDMVKRGEEISVATIIANVQWPVEREEFERYLTGRGWFYAIKTDSFMPPDWVAMQRHGATAIIMDEWGPPVSDAVRAMRPSLNDYYKDGINECPQAEEIMRKHGYWPDTPVHDAAETNDGKHSIPGHWEPK